MKTGKIFLYLFIGFSSMIFIVTGFRSASIYKLNNSKEKSDINVLPDLKIFNFKFQESKILPGLSTEQASG